MKFLKQHKIDGRKGFDKIFFNFPYPVYNGIRFDPSVEIPKILSDFMLQAKNLLSSRGEIIIGGYNDSYRRSYYMPEQNVLKNLGFKLEEFPWDPHAILSKYGYEHRDSTKNRSVNTSGNSKNASMFIFHH